MRGKLYFDINDIDESHIDPNETYRLYNYTLTGNELLVNTKNISSILEGKTTIDFIGINPIFNYLLRLISSSKSVVVNNVFDTPNVDIAELDKIMISDTIVVTDLSAEAKDVIKNSLEGKKEVIFTQLYKEEEKENSFGKTK